MIESRPELDHVVERYLSLKDSAKDDAARENLWQAIAELDAHYWQLVEETIRPHLKEKSERLLFTKYDRMLIDAGLVDARLLGKDLERVEAALVRELYAEGEANVYYLSEWLAERYKAFLLFGRVRKVEDGTTPEPLQQEIIPEKLLAALLKVYAALRPHFELLPGIERETVDYLCSGALDAQIFRCLMRAGPDEESAKEEAAHYKSLKEKFLSRARGYVRGEKTLELFDALWKMDRALEEECKRSRSTIAAVHDVGYRKIPFKERLKFIAAELKLVRALLILGTPDSGVTRVRSVLLSDERRTTRPEVTALLRSVQEVDPNLPGMPSVLIAPYTGTGFFEWDRDTLFVPLISTRATDEAIVTALANYRIMVDSLQTQGKLKFAYEREVTGGDFRGNFIRDYKAWVLGVSRGFRGAMGPSSYEFFKKHVGPDPNGVIAPADILNASPEELSETIRKHRSRINRNEGTFEDYFRLGVAFWKLKNFTEALDNVAVAVKINPADGMAVFALGVLCEKLGHTGKARRAYQECIKVAPNTLWQVYGAEKLTKMG